MKPKYARCVDFTKINSFEEYFSEVQRLLRLEVPVDRNYLELSEGETCPGCGSWDTYWSKSHHLVCNKCGEVNSIVLG